LFFNLIVRTVNSGGQSVVSPELVLD